MAQNQAIEEPLPVSSAEGSLRWRAFVVWRRAGGLQFVRFPWSSFSRALMLRTLWLWRFETILRRRSRIIAPQKRPDRWAPERRPRGPGRLYLG